MISNRIKIYGILGLVGTGILMSACSQEEETHSAATQGGTQLVLAPQISSSIETRQEKNVWEAGDSIGVFVCKADSGVDSPYLGRESYSNVCYAYGNSLWTASREVNLGIDPASVYAYFPFMEQVDPRAVPVSLEGQTDYLYGKADTLVNYQQKVATIRMKHAMTQFVLQLTLGQYEGEGVVTNIRLLNADGKEHIVDGGHLDIESGEITGGKSDTLTIYDCDTLSIKGSKLQLSSILVPTHKTQQEGDIRLEITIDGKVFYYDFRAGTDWKAGYKNIYRSSINSNALVIDPEKGIIIEPWQDKSDNPEVELIPVS